MSSDTVIRVENVSKRYTIHHANGSSGEGLRHAIQDGVTKRLRSLKNITKSKTEIESEKALNSRVRSSEDFYALRDVSFEVKRGDVLGVIGRNGAGKSTLLKVLSRITEPSSGRIGIKGRVASLLEVGTGFHPELTGRENVYLNGAILGMAQSEVRQKFDEIVAFSEVERFLDTPVKRYSSGMYVRLAFAVAAHMEPEVLVVDEVLAVGDAAFQNKCLGKMHDVAAKEGRTVLFVSHNLPVVSKLCNRAILLESGRLTKAGPTHEIVEAYSTTATPTEISFQDFSKRKGSGDTRFTSARLLNSEGYVVSEYCIGDDLNVEFTIRNFKKSPTLTVAVELATADGFKIANMIDRDSVFTLTRHLDEETILVKLPDLRFYPGTYLVGLFAGGREGGDTYDYAPDCLSFTIVAGGRYPQRDLPRSAGLLFLTPEWKSVKGAPVERLAATP